LILKISVCSYLLFNNWYTVTRWRTVGNSVVYATGWSYSISYLLCRGQ